MANFFEKINKTGQSAMQKAKDANEISRLNEMVRAEQKKQNLAYCEIGRAFVLSIEEGENLNVANEPLASLLLSIKECSSNIEKLQENILRIKNVKRCPVCGRECSDDSIFCSGCGKQLPAHILQPNRAHHCVNCGAEIADDDMFCFSCGKKIER